MSRSIIHQHRERPRGRQRSRLLVILFLPDLGIYHGQSTKEQGYVTFLNNARIDTDFYREGCRVCVDRRVKVEHR